MGATLLPFLKLKNMAFELLGKACFVDRCSRLIFTDITGNTATGWGGDYDGNNVATASLTITYPNGSIQVIDLRLQMPSPSIVGDLVFDPIDPLFNSFADGFYSMVYSVTMDDDVVFSVTVETYNYCNIECSIQGEWARVADMARCNPCYYKDLLSQTLEAEAILTALKRSSQCGSCKDISDDLMDVLISITKYGGCGCE